MIFKIFLFIVIVIQEGHGGYGDYRQCSCAEQSECFGEIIKGTEKCFEVSYDEVKNELIKEQADPTKTAPCFDKFTNFVKQWLGCVDTKLAKESSCLSCESSDVKISSDDFLPIYVKVVIENVNKRMDYLFGLGDQAFVKLDQKWHDSAKECAFDKAAKIKCFAEKNCAVKAGKNEVQKAVDECYNELDVVKVQYNQCDCLTNNVPCEAFGLNCYCDKLKCAKLPEV